MSQRHVYQELPTVDSIRLLHLPLSERDSLHCILYTVPLKQAPRYTALSYCWGSPIGTIPITCGDTDTFLNVTPNLHAFLTQFTGGGVKDRAQYLWIDAICINQEDISERNAQVLIMRDIYHQADQVIGWLGESTEESDWAMGFLSEIITVSVDGTRIKDEILKAVHSQLGSKDLLRLLNLSQWEALTKLVNSSPSVESARSSFLSRKWFQRAWIVQEIAVARELRLMCGSQCMLWEVFEIGLHVMGAAMNFSPDWSYYCAALGNVRRKIVADEDMNLMDLLQYFRMALATDPRDKVYAFLGLAADTGYDGSIIKPDYSLDVMTAEVSLDVFRICLPNAQSTDLTLPSWVPDWSQLGGTVQDPIRIRSRKESRPVLRAAGDSKLEAQVSVEWAMLGLHGFVVEKITEVAPIAKHEEPHSPLHLIRSYQSLLQDFILWENFANIRSQTRYAPTGEMMLDAYLRTISAGARVKLSQDRQGQARQILPREVFLRWRNTFMPYDWVRKLIGDRFAASALISFLLVVHHTFMGKNYDMDEATVSAALKGVRNRRLIRTERGFLGLAPREAQVGDSIAIFKGGCVPFVIRNQEENWTLVGDVYVHGMVDGELFDEDRCKLMWLV